MGQKHSRQPVSTGYPKQAHTVAKECASGTLKRLGPSLAEIQIPVGNAKDVENSTSPNNKALVLEQAPFIVMLSDAKTRGLTVSHLGGKGLRLQELSLAGRVSVPEGLVVTTSLYEEIVSRKLGLKFSFALSDSQLSEARARISKAALPDDVTASLSALLQQFPSTHRWAVRSSATAEDGAEFSLAGLAESYLWVDRNDVVDAIRRCWCSLWERRVIAYLSQQTQQLSQPHEVRMAVVVQRMVPAAASGVLFTLHATKGLDRYCGVECVYGAGEALVSGRVTPYAYVVDWPARKVALESDKSHVQEEKMARRADGKEGLETVPTTGDERKHLPLSDQQVMELCDMGLEIARYYGRPQDIEWCLEEGTGKFRIVQTRPITKFNVSALDGYYYDAFAHKSWLAMSLSSMSGYYESKKMGSEGKLKEEDAIVPIYGLAYVNHALNDAFNKKSSQFLSWKESMPDIVESFVTHALEVEPILWKIVCQPKELKQEDMMQLVATMLGERLELGFLSFFVGSECRELEKLLPSELAASRCGVSLEECLSNVRPESSFQVHELVSLAHIMFKDPKARDILLDPKIPLSGIIPALSNLPCHANLMAYLRKFFYTCEQDEDILEERWIDNPAQMLIILRLHVSRLQSGLALGTSSSSQRTFSPEKLAQFPKLLAMVMKLRTWLRCKDEIHECYVRGNFFMCKILQEFNRRLKMEENDIFHVSHRTLSQYCHGSISLDDLLMEVNSHKTIRLMFRNFETPRYIYRHAPAFRSDEPPPSAPPDDEADNILFRLTGVGGSGGTVEGIVRVCNSLSDAVSLKQGEILVTEMTSPAWTPLFHVISAVVTEMGGRLSHAAVVARELELPAVLSVKSAQTRLKTGMRVRVNGNIGRVDVLSDKPVEADLSVLTRSRLEEDAEEDPQVASLIASRDDLCASRNA